MLAKEEKLNALLDKQIDDQLMLQDLQNQQIQIELSAQAKAYILSKEKLENIEVMLKVEEKRRVSYKEDLLNQESAIKLNRDMADALKMEKMFIRNKEEIYRKNI